MEKLRNFYRELPPQTRFWLIFFVLASLIWVPIRRNTGVEVYEPYRYDIDDVEDNQVVFAYQFTNFAWGKQRYIWIIRKDGMCRMKDLSKYPAGLEWTDEELLERMDEYMQDEALPQMDERLMLTREEINYCINVEKIELGPAVLKSMDGGGGTFYVVSGTGESRHLIEMGHDGAFRCTCGNHWINQVCNEIKEVCMSY